MAGTEEPRPDQLHRGCSQLFHGDIRMAGFLMSQENMELSGKVSWWWKVSKKFKKKNLWDKPTMFMSRSSLRPHTP